MGHSMRTFRRWSPRYIAARCRLAIYERLHPDHPWLNQYAISVIEKHLRKTHVALEWGSGRSTSWLAPRVASLVSVESNLEWYQQVSKRIEALKLTNVQLLHETDEDAYVNVADRFADESVDFVLVDGAFARDRCAIRAVNKIKPNGMLAIDNASWFLPTRSPSPMGRTLEDGPVSERWREFLSLVDGWEPIWTKNGVPYKDTAIYVKR